MSLFEVELEEEAECWLTGVEFWTGLGELVGWTFKGADMYPVVTELVEEALDVDEVEYGDVFCMYWFK